MISRISCHDVYVIDIITISFKGVVHRYLLFVKPFKLMIMYIIISVNYKVMSSSDDKDISIKSRGKACHTAHLNS